jgi:ribosome-associated protein
MFNDPYDEAPPSKSQLKREAHALQALGEALVGLNKAVLAKIPMPEALRNAILEAQHIRQRGALKRQLQFIGRLMRETTEADAIRQAYEQATHPLQQDVAQHHRIERWRDRLLTEGDTALGEWLAENPDTDRQHIRQLLRAAAKERATGKPPKSARELFRYLKEVANSG